MSFGFQGSADAWMLAGGYDVLGAKVQEITFLKSIMQQATHGVGDRAPESTPTGMEMAETKVSGGFFKTNSGVGLHALIGAQGRPLDPNGTPLVVSLGFAGKAVGLPCIQMQGNWLNTYEVTSENEKLQRANVGHTVTGIIEDSAVVLQSNGTPYTADGNSESTPSDHALSEGQQTTPITSASAANPSIVTTPVPHGRTSGDTVVISGMAGTGAGTANAEHVITVTGTLTFTIPVDLSGGGATGGTFVVGKTQAGGAGVLQVTSLSLGGFTSLRVQLRHKASGGAFANLGSAFTDVTAVRKAERITVAGAVNRLLALSVVFVGAGASPSASFLVSFQRG